MAYDSDIRIKEDFKRIGTIGNLKLRVFDESHDDHRLWENNGLTFAVNKVPYGSNDGVWYKNEPWVVNGIKKSNFTPVVAVEGSYGTERGNTGSAQYARFSHALGAVMNGVLGVYLLPKESTYIQKSGIGTTVSWRFDMVYGCLGATKEEGTPYLMIDAYNKQAPTLRELISTLAKGDKNAIDSVINYTLNQMRDYADDRFKKTYKTSTLDWNLCINDKKRSYAYNKETVGRISMFNVVAFSNQNFRLNIHYKSGRFRNGHTILGDALLHHYWFMKPIDLIFPRWTREDCKRLDKFAEKEWLVLRTRPDINIITIDDLSFENKQLETKLRKFMDVLPLTGSALKTKNVLLSDLKQEFRKGSISIDRESVADSKSEAINLFKESVLNKNL